MKIHWIEGVYTPAGNKKERAPFYQSFYAETPAEALRMARESILGGKWVEGPRLCPISEEERMRALGAPELPLFGAAPEKKSKKTK